MNRVRQELIRNELMNIIDEYPRELGLIMDELISLLNDSQLDKMQILIDKFDSLGDVSKISISPLSGNPLR